MEFEARVAALSSKLDDIYASQAVIINLLNELVAAYGGDDGGELVQVLRRLTETIGAAVTRLDAAAERRQQAEALPV